MRRHWWWIVLLAAGTVGAWWLSRPTPVHVDVATVVRGPARASVEEEGRTRVIDRFVVSATVTGRLLRVELEEGDPVEKDVPVALIDPLPLQSRVDEIEAQIRAIEQRIDGVGTKKPKPEELEKARVLEQTASESLTVAERGLTELQVILDQAEKDLERLRELRRKERISAAELENADTAARQARARVLAQQDRLRIRRLAISVAKLEYAVLQARRSDFDWEEKVYREQVEGLKATLRSITADLKRTQIAAPVSGTVLTVHRKSEQVVQAGAPILEVADLDRLEVEAEFLSEDAAHMREGMVAEVFGRALGERVIVGVVQKIEPRAFEKVSSLGVEQQRVNVIVEFDAKGLGLGDGFRVEVRVILDRHENALLVPEGALFRERGSWHVFRVEDGKAVRTAVETGIQDGRSREILSGLQEGAVVIVHPGDAVENGRRVESLPSAEERGR